MSTVCRIWFAFVVAVATGGFGCQRGPAGAPLQAPVSPATAGPRAVETPPGDPVVNTPPARILTHLDVDDRLSGSITGDRYRIVYDNEDAIKGAPEPTVTIVVFSDFQCPYCQRLSGTLDQLVTEYPSDVRVVHKHHPLAFHNHAEIAARASEAAKLQGRFWPMHDIMFRNQPTLDRDKLINYAGELGMDVIRFKADLDRPEIAARVAADVGQAAHFGVRGTPHFFVNGLSHSGAQPIDKLRKLVDDEIVHSHKLLKAGSKRPELYARILRAASPDEPPPPSRAPTPGKAAPSSPDPAKLYAVPTGKAPSVGPADALVTIVAFVDYQDPFTKRVMPTLGKVLADNPDTVRIVFRNLPLPFHPEAVPAAKAILAAHKQRKFVAMREAVLERMKELTPGIYPEIADAAGLDVRRFKKDLRSKALATQIAADEKLAKRFGTRGTPSFFINGRPLVGAQPKAKFDEAVAEAMARGQAHLSKTKVAKRKLYANMIRGFDKRVPRKLAADQIRRIVDVKGLPRRGSKKAKVKIVMCTDFHCPFCKRAAPTMKKLLRKYKGKVALYFKHLPLPFHKDARLAHRAALAAHAQGKFWKMYDLIFENQDKRTTDELAVLAKRAGLNMSKWHRSLEDPAHEKTMDADTQSCNALDIKGTPGFLINGRKLSGARPFEDFADVIDEELSGGFEASK